ncbi:MAG TPA: hypothetical protein VI636_14430 [Candidatus Angelobacter sp.]
MNQDNRVLQRIGARELTREEIENITGAINTLTAFCSAPQPKYPTGDSDHEGCPW